MTCISRDMQSLNSAAPAQQPRERSSGRSKPRPMGRGAPGMGKGARPQLPHSQPSCAWMLFLDARARNSSPAPVPSIRPLFHGNQQAAAAAAASRQGRTRTTCKPAQPSQRFLQRSIAPCPHRNVRPGLCLSSRGGQGSRQTLTLRRRNKHTLARCVPTFAFTTPTINITVFVALVSTRTAHYRQPDLQSIKPV